MSALRTEPEGKRRDRGNEGGELEVLLVREARELLDITGVEFAAKRHLRLGLRMRYRFIERDDIEGGPWKVSTLAFRLDRAFGEA